MTHRELVIIGAGPAGMSAAVSAYDAGVRDILLLERADGFGGILRQCIHNGFGLHKFGEELTGPEYALRYEKMVEERKIECRFGTMVTDLSPSRIVTAVSPDGGIEKLEAGAVILAMGCRERPRGALNIPGSRPAGIYTAGTAQKFVNILGWMPGREVVILGSGDIGLIMARRLTLEGAKVKAVCEIMPYSGGLARNIQQCLNDFDIPLKLSHTVVDVRGRDRLEGVTIARVDEKRRPVAGTEEELSCDTLLLSVGLIPENELSKSAGVELDPVTGGAVVDQNRQTSVEGVFACGNVLHVHDLVDYVSDEGETAGRAAAAYLGGAARGGADIRLKAGAGIRYTVPRIITQAADTEVFFRVSDVFRNVNVVLRRGDETLLTKRRARVAPGEMENLTLPAALLEGAAGAALTLELEGKNE